jgi:hypothetical protein
MKSIRSFTLLKLAVGLLAATCFTSGLAQAQNLAGKFSLPFEAHWGLATLPAGDYSFTVEGMGPDATVHVYRGADTVLNMANQSYETKLSSKTSLIVERNSAGNFVRDLNLPGKVLHYAPHVEGGSADREREIARIPVTTGTK